MQKFVSH